MDDWIITAQWALGLGMLGGVKGEQGLRQALRFIDLTASYDNMCPNIHFISIL